MRRRVWRMVGIVVSVLMVACSGSGPTGPGSAGLGGTWTGTVTEAPGGGAGTLRLTVQQTGGGFTGIFSVQFVEASFNRAGTMQGLVGATTTAVAISSDAADCPVGRTLGGSVLNMTWTQRGDSLQGTYEGFACFGNVAGTFEVARQR